MSPTCNAIKFFLCFQISCKRWLLHLSKILKYHYFIRLRSIHVSPTQGNWWKGCNTWFMAVADSDIKGWHPNLWGNSNQSKHGSHCCSLRFGKRKFTVEFQSEVCVVSWYKHIFRLSNLDSQKDPNIRDCRTRKTLLNYWVNWRNDQGRIWTQDLCVCGLMSVELVDCYPCLV